MGDIITPEQFEVARQAFVAAWEQTEAGAKGTRTTAGLLAALNTLGIAVEWSNDE